MIRSLRAEEISCEGRSERKELAELLANEMTMGPLLEFLESAEVGGKRVKVGARNRSGGGRNA